MNASDRAFSYHACFNIIERSQNGYTPLHIAAENRLKHIVSVLLVKGKAFTNLKNKVMLVYIGNVQRLCACWRDCVETYLCMQSLFSPNVRVVRSGVCVGWTDTTSSRCLERPHRGCVSVAVEGGYGHGHGHGRECNGQGVWPVTVPTVYYCVLHIWPWSHCAL
jgi:hypothetical protein